jgi:YD repeat-containing protein
MPPITSMTQTTLTRRALATVLAALQALPMGMLSTTAQAQQTVPTEYGYDAQGNLTKILDPNGKLTEIEPDSLNRVKTQTLPPAVDGGTRPTVNYTYDGLNRLRSVRDPKGNLTQYAYKGLNDYTQSSPDTGLLFNYFHASGNLEYRTNAREKGLAVDLFDGLNRPVKVAYFHEISGVSDGEVGLSYDEFITTAGDANNYGRGHLTRVFERDGANQIIYSLSFRYDIFGHLTRRCQFLTGLSAGSYTACTDADALKYRWNTQPSGVGNPNAGRLMGLTYPSGRLVDYTYDSSGRISGITTQHPDPATGQVPASATAKAVISSVDYTPMDVAANGHAVTEWKFGDGTTAPVQSYARSYTVDGRMDWYTLGMDSLNFGTQYSHELLYDQAGHLKVIRGRNASGGATNVLYEYDNLGRLKKATLPGSVIYNYDYDANGNRTLKTSASITTNYTYPANNNSLQTVQTGSAASQAVTHDYTGNITNDPTTPVGAVIYTYDDRTNVPYGRLVKSQGAGAQWSYLHNHFGQRIRKTGAPYTPSGGATITPAAYIGSTDTVFHYDMQGQLLAEQDATSKQVKREYIWFDGMVVGVIAGATPTNPITTANPATLYHVHSDHLNTPRMVTDAAGNRRWSWSPLSAEPFGATAPIDDPMGQVAAQKFTLNLRFPGQYLDK